MPFKKPAKARSAHSTPGKAQFSQKRSFGFGLLFNKYRVYVFVIAFALIGGAALVYSMAAPTTVTLFGTAKPSHPTDADPQAVELGMKFKSSVDGEVTGVRFYKGSRSNGGIHKGSLWAETGTRLATVNFASETRSGWQQVNFTTPVKITQGTVYVVSYYAPKGNYAGDVNYFISPRTVGPLTGLDSLYRYSNSSTFPTGSYQKTNYYVDVLFKYDPSANVPTPTPAPAPAPAPVPAPSPAPVVSGNFCSTFPAVPATKPTAANTGVPGGTTLAASGDITASTAGMVINAKDVSGGIYVTANNVTIQNSKIHATGSSYMGIRVADNVTGTKILYSDIYTSNGGYEGILGGNLIACGNDISGFDNPLTIGDSAIVQANYIHNLNSAQSDPHYDGIEIYYGSNHKVYGNYIAMTDKNGNWLNETNAINLTAYNNNISGTVITGNWIGGGGWTLGVRQQGSYKYSNITVTNNRWLGTAPKGFAAAGPCDIQPTAVTSSGNVWDVDSKSVGC